MTYFNVPHKVVLEIARAEKKADVELLMLDDCWVGRRDSTLSGLRNVYPKATKFPFGMDGVRRAVNELGLKFGIVVKPGMPSFDSNLYRVHVDWCLCVPKRSRSTGRNQLVLDLSRQEMRHHIY